jgi:phenylpropionate dioxygenase-like ring-hydroxylating dioxygenase large terminal subunit
MADGGGLGSERDGGEREDIRRLVNMADGTVDRKLFSDTELYQLELERIFARAWNFMCHESQIPKPGDFFLSYIGEDSVIATRDKKGQLQVLLNTCRHRGNAVCRAEQGHANSFLCTYHGWTYGLDGKLIGVPGFKDYYHGELEREKWGLVTAAKVASYKGFVFATMDPQAPELDEYLGETGRLCLNLIAARGDVVVVEGVQKNVIGCNWKFATENQFDMYHAPISHASAYQSDYGRGRERANTRIRAKDPRAPHRVVLGEYGHAISGPKLTRGALGAQDEWRETAEARQQLGDVGIETAGHALVFPNLWVSRANTPQLCMRIPRGPLSCEIWGFMVVERNDSEAQKRDKIEDVIHVIGPAGMLEQEDGENWDQSTRACVATISKRYPLNLSMGKGQGKVEVDPVSGLHYIDTVVNEYAQLWMYQSWADWMAAPDWGSMRRTRTALPEGSY